ncbi:MAG: hypothetical protein WCG80_10710 [Spirochaetales bacterium]
MTRTLLAVLASGAWIGASEFARNELLFKSFWLAHYAGLGIGFPSSMANNAVWGLWSFVFAACVVFLVSRLKFWETVAVAWVMAFVLMWLTIGNLGVLPYGLLWFAVPLSVLEAVLAAWIAKAICNPSSAR